MACVSHEIRETSKWLLWVVSHQDALINEQDCGVGFEVDALGFLDDFEALDGDVSLVSQAETDNVQHVDFCISSTVLLNVVVTAFNRTEKFPHHHPTISSHSTLALASARSVTLSDAPSTRLLPAIRHRSFEAKPS